MLAPSARPSSGPRARSGARARPRNRARGLRFAAWPLFGLLAALHLVVLPLVVAGHVAVLLAAGLAYAALAVADVVSRRREPHPGR